MNEPAGLLKELAEVGIIVDSVWDFINIQEDYPDAIPILAEWLDHLEERVEKDDQPKIREGIARALTVKYAKSAVPVLIRKYEDIDDPKGWNRWSIANALEVAADDRYFDEIAKLITNRGFGPSRQMLVEWLGHSKNPRAIPLLLEMIGDEEVKPHAIHALGRKRAHEALTLLQEMTEDPDALVRKEAKNALTKIKRDIGEK